MKTVNAILAIWVFGFLLSGIMMADGAVRFGPYEAIQINSEIVRGVKVEESGKIWLLLNPDYRELKLVVRISNLEGTDYRKWYTGDLDLVSPANQGKQANAWTDWIETRAAFIEYWMEGKKILHLKKVK